MKKIIALMLTLVVFSAFFAGCSSTAGAGGSVGGIDNEAVAVLEEAGFSEEEISAMSEEEIAAIAAELGVVIEYEEQQKEQQAESKAERVTIEDVEKDGSYVVTVGDSMMWNYFELHYENGKLVKIVTSFQKNDEEEADVEVVEGNAVAEYGLFFIDYTMPASDVVDALQNQGYTNVYIEKAN